METGRTIPQSCDNSGIYNFCIAVVDVSNSVIPSQSISLIAYTYFSTFYFHYVHYFPLLILLHHSRSVLL